ncbi:MAG: hypothetical protein ACJ754_12660 [Pyrinomonadaceae bacterium]
MSSSEQDRVRESAERVARRLEGGSREQDGAGGSGGGELAAVRASLAEIQRRLTHIESHIAHGEDCGHGTRQPDDARSTPTSSTPNPSTQARSTWLSGTYVPATTAHPSQEQFEGLGEAVSELVEFFEREKTCTLEPGDKPCDHCGQCSSRGF